MSCVAAVRPLDQETARLRAEKAELAAAVIIANDKIVAMKYDMAVLDKRIALLEFRAKVRE